MGLCLPKLAGIFPTELLRDTFVLSNLPEVQLFAFSQQAWGSSVHSPSENGEVLDDKEVPNANTWNEDTGFRVRAPFYRRLQIITSHFNGSVWRCSSALFVIIIVGFHLMISLNVWVLRPDLEHPLICGSASHVS
jgi:hypothetical protein